MLTPGHAILNSVLLRKKEKNPPYLYIVWGAVAPDLSMLVFFLWNRFVAGYSARYIFEDLYFNSGWAGFIDVFHSFPLLGAVAIFCYLKKLRRSFYFFLSMFVHSLFDFPLHNTDAHRHFFPFSNYKFRSPLSYWDPAHYGSIMAISECLLILVLSFYLWRKISSKTGRLMIFLADIFYVFSIVSHSMR